MKIVGRPVRPDAARNQFCGSVFESKQQRKKWKKTLPYRTYRYPSDAVVVNVAYVAPAAPETACQCVVFILVCMCIGARPPRFARACMQQVCYAAPLLQLSGVVAQRTLVCLRCGVLLNQPLVQYVCVCVRAYYLNYKSITTTNTH